MRNSKKFIKAYNKLEEGIYILTIGYRDLKQRLIHCSRKFIYSLKVEDFPQYLKEDYEWICEQLTKKEPLRTIEGKVLVDQITMSVKHLRKSKIEDIVRRILYLRDKLDALINEKEITRFIY